jgi:predicted ester cyclase
MKKDLAAIDELLDAKILIHSRLGNFTGRDSMKKIVGSWMIGFPDLTVDHMAVVCENDRVFIQWKAQGTHVGEFKGIAATNRKIHYEGVTIYRINMGKIVEYWSYPDMQHLLEQLR